MPLEYEKLTFTEIKNDTPHNFGPHQIGATGVQNFMMALHMAFNEGGKDKDGAIAFSVCPCGPAKDAVPIGVEVEIIGYFTMLLPTFEYARHFANHLESGLHLFGESAPLGAAFPPLIMSVREAIKTGEAAVERAKASVPPAPKPAPGAHLH